MAGRTGLNNPAICIPFYPVGTPVRVVNPDSVFFKSEGVVYAAHSGFVWCRVWKYGVEVSVGFRAASVERIQSSNRGVQS